jgi:two-component system, NarL family, invasion response regulator UvrY
MMRILIADDYPLFRLGVRELLSRGLAGARIAEAGDFHEMLDLLRRKPYDALIMDITMPGMTGLAALKQVKQEYPALPVVILSQHPEEQYAIRMFKAGADGYLTKATAPEELVKAVHKVSTGGKYVSAALGETLALSVQTNMERPPHEALSDREYEVLCLFGKGKTVGEIAESTHLSVTTISTYRSRILEKMRLKTTAELTRYAIEHRLSL